MYYKHLFAALTAAFFLCIGAIAAQKSKSALSDDEFHKALVDEEPQVYEYAKGEQLSIEQLKFLLMYELYNERNTEYIDTLKEVYWQQLGHKGRLIYENLYFADTHLFLTAEESDRFELSMPFEYVIKHKKEYKKAWGDSLFNQFIQNKLKVECVKIGCEGGMDFDYTDEEIVQNAELYGKSIQRVLPEYEEFAKLHAFIHCVYDEYDAPKKYYNYLDKYLIKYENDPQVLNLHASLLVKINNEKYVYKLGLDWVNKAIAIQNKPEYNLTKATLLFLTGQETEARILLMTTLSTIKENDRALIRAAETTYQRLFKDIE